MIVDVDSDDFVVLDPVRHRAVDAIRAVPKPAGLWRIRINGLQLYLERTFRLGQRHTDPHRAEIGEGEDLVGGDSARRC